MNYVLDFLAPLLIIFLAEIGDKTNLIALSLMVQTRRPYSVVVGSLLGIGTMTLLGVVLGSFLGGSLPIPLIWIGSGLLFVFLGFNSLKNNEETNEGIEINHLLSQKETILKAIVLVGFAEVGDKSQLFVISSASTQDPFLVFLGAILAFTLVFGLTAIFGEKILNKIPKHILELSVSVIFIVIGLYQIISGVQSL